MKIQLPNVTLIALTSIKIPETIKAMEYSMRGIDFGAVKLVSDKYFYHAKIKHELCPLMDTIDKYNEYCFIELGSHVDTEFALVTQYDAGILRPNLWNNEWLKFSFIGSPWPIVENSYMANNGERARVGNGGFSLRDRIVLDTPKKLGWELRQEQSYFSEDGNINCYWRKEFIENGIKYAPVEVAARFSYENEVEENRNLNDIFGFHKHIRWEWKEELGL